MNREDSMSEATVHRGSCLAPDLAILTVLAATGVYQSRPGELLR